MKHMFGFGRTVALIAMTAALLSCSADTERIETTEILAATTAGPESREVSVVFIAARAAGCGQFDAADVREEATTVTVTVTLRTTARDCPDDGVQTERAVQLRRPLDARELIDGSTDKPVEVQRP